MNDKISSELSVKAKSDDSSEESGLEELELTAVATGRFPEGSKRSSDDEMIESSNSRRKTNSGIGIPGGLGGKLNRSTLQPLELPAFARTGEREDDIMRRYASLRSAAPSGSNSQQCSTNTTGHPDPRFNSAITSELARQGYSNDFFNGGVLPPQGNALAAGIGANSMGRPELSAMLMNQHAREQQNAMMLQMQLAQLQPSQQALLQAASLGNRLPPQPLFNPFASQQQLDLLHLQQSLLAQQEDSAFLTRIVTHQKVGESGSDNANMASFLDRLGSPSATTGQPPSPGTNPPASTQTTSLTPKDLPSCFNHPLAPWSSRPFFPLGIDEDANWLSEFHCFVRNELVELFRASEDDVKARNGSIASMQLGMRCRYCAHLSSTAKTGRSSAFPSSLRQIYQSFTMMLRDHFGGCEAIPGHLLHKFIELKDKPAQGATDSKRYWIYSAMKVGMSDTKEGIKITEASRATGAAAGPFGSHSGKQWDDESYASIPLVLPADRPRISEFLYLIMTQVQPIRLMESECIGNRRSLRVGLPGFGCRYCCEGRRLGQCRMFPARRRTLPGKISDVYDHLRRCSLCPANVKEQLERLKHQLDDGFLADRGSDRDFFDRVWSRLGHDSQSA